MAFDTGKKISYLHINSINDLDEQKSLPIPLFISFVSCDSCSTAFLVKEKKIALEARNC